MGKLYEKITKINSISNIDQEYEINTSDDFNDDKFRGYSQLPKHKKESQIIKEIKSGADYRTDDKTPVVISKKNGVEYIHSKNNNTLVDNLLNLPKY
jgi:hypothetical protein